MSLAGAGAVAIWNGITPEGRSNFYEWHGREHIPERVAIPGFLNGRRYVAECGDPEYFTLYETATTQALTGTEYLSRLNNPSPWTVKSTAHFRQVARSLCAVACSAGRGSGGLIATWRYELTGDRESHIRRMVAAMQLVAEMPGVAGAHFLITDPLASGTDTEERRKRGTPSALPGWIVLVEAWGDLDPFKSLCQSLQHQYFEDAVEDAAHGIYRLQSQLAATPAVR